MKLADKIKKRKYSSRKIFKHVLYFLEPSRFFLQHLWKLFGQLSRKMVLTKNIEIIRDSLERFELKYYFVSYKSDALLNRF